jgi:polysaccharide pyruvyl transferase WcaK-like protein
LKEIIEIDIVADITGGDSFSDIYGMRRFVLGFLRKWLVLLYGKKLIMLPQTYGPFKGTLTKTMAKYIMRRASVIYSRDRSGVSYVRELLNNRNFENKVRFVPDVAFVLDSHKPENIDIGLLETVRAKDSVVIGLNVSGLLYNRGHIMNEMFGLKTDYRQLVYQLARLLLKNDKVKLLLVPHVLPPAPAVINDAVACLELYKQLGREHPGRKFLVKGKYDQGEIKYIIGLCDFFIGSRMHACIAALSQCIPTVGIAYSDKFRGVFESVGVGYCVADARNMDIKGVFEIIESAYNKRVEIQKYLHKRAPSNIKAVLSIFNELK